MDETHPRLVPRRAVPTRRGCVEEGNAGYGRGTVCCREGSHCKPPLCDGGELSSSRYPKETNKAPASFVKDVLAASPTDSGETLEYETRLKHVSGTVFAGVSSTFFQSRVTTNKRCSWLRYSTFPARTRLSPSFTLVQTVSVLLSAILLLVKHPTVLRKAQVELDTKILSSGRLPDMGDEDALPYIAAVLLETLRISPVLPTSTSALFSASLHAEPCGAGVVHLLETDDVYNGYHLPGKSVVVGNAWAILRDPIAYPEPEVFKPERWLTGDGSAINKEVRTPEASGTFGFGRRMCPGKHLAWATVWHALARMVAVFDLGEMEGREVSGEYVSGLFR